MTIDEIKKIAQKRRWKYSHILSDEYHDFIDLFPNVVLISDVQGKIIQCNSEALGVLGYSRKEMLEKISIEDLVPDEYRKHHPQKRKDFFKTLQPRVIGNRSVDLFARRKSGETFQMDASLIPLVSTKGDLALSIITDLTYIKKLQNELEKSNAELEESNAKLQKIALLDSLTGIPNRRCFDEVLNSKCSEAKRHTLELSLLYMDLDKFKPVNDKYGHDVGDILLIEVVKRVKSILRFEDFIARLGGDEFAIILPHTDNRMAMEVSRKISLCLSNRYYIQGHIINISVSIGICTLCKKSYTPEIMLKNADNAMYKAKNNTEVNINNCYEYNC